MAKAKRQVDVSICKPFITYDFGIASSVAGTEHAFMYKGYPIKIALPGKPRKKMSEIQIYVFTAPHG